MSGWLALLPAVFLATVYVYCCLLVLRAILKAVWFYRSMRKAAHALSLRYIQPVITRPPTLCGTYRGREVVIDYVDYDVGSRQVEVTRVRAFHKGELAQEFSVGDLESLRNIGKDAACRRLASDDERFERAFVVTGGDLKIIRKFLDERLRKSALEWGRPFSVGAFDISFSRPGRITDKKTLSEALDFLSVVAAKADRLK
jgi:hypothetical protein